MLGLDIVVCTTARTDKEARPCCVNLTSRSGSELDGSDAENWNLMAKKSAIENNLRKQRLAKKFAGRRKRSCSTSPTTTAVRWRSASTSTSGSLRFRATSAIVHCCEVTGRPRGFYRKMRMSRIALRELGNKGLIPGHGQVEL